MEKEVRISQVLGLIDSTLGSARPYNAVDYRRRLAMSAALLRDDEAAAKELGKTDLQRQAFLDGPFPDKKARIEVVRQALHEIYALYQLQGESGTEELFHLLDNAMDATSGDIRRGHENGLCTDCLSSLARHLDEEFVNANAVTV